MNLRLIPASKVDDHPSKMPFTTSMPAKYMLAMAGGKAPWFVNNRLSAADCPGYCRSKSLPVLMTMMRLKSTNLYLAALMSDSRVALSSSAVMQYSPVPLVNSLDDG